MKLEEYSVCLFDIEGTTTPISFVHEVLFPYSKEKMSDFIFSGKLAHKIVAELILENRKDIEEGLFSAQILGSDHIVNLPALVSYLQYLIRVDRKSKPLKEIQGQIWKVGYENAELKSILFADVTDFFKRLEDKKIQIGIYSSGSVEAQKYIFRYSNFGDLTKYISFYFDTNIGGKREKQSYEEIARLIRVTPNQILFFTDVKEEADAAENAGLSVFILDRPGNHPQPPHHYSILQDFTSLL
ncbi:MAG: acireductone synthase [Leptospiraceae bacterium]|nr:acireductone synthase [Leptospiraceae bacterium]